MSRRLLQRNVNEGTARKKVRLILSSEVIAVFVIYRMRILIFVSRVEEYVSRKLDQNIVDPDPERIYTKRKLHRMNSTSEKSVGDSAMASSSTPSPVSQWKPKIPSDVWGLSLEKVPLFTRAEMDRHIGMSGKHIGGDKHAHHSVPTGFKKAKTYLEDEYLHDIQTNYDQQYFYYRAKCFHSFKRNESPHNLIIALCIISGEVVFANCGPSCGAGKSGFCNHVLALMLKMCKYTLYNCKKCHRTTT